MQSWLIQCFVFFSSSAVQQTFLFLKNIWHYFASVV